MDKQCRDCGRGYDVVHLPTGDGVRFDRCDECNALVYAVQVDASEPPHMIAASDAALANADGDRLGLPQCENCGNVEFAYDHGRRTVVCSGDDGCGHTYSVTRRRAYSVVW